MSVALKHQQGFSLPEVLLSLILMVMVVTALSGYQRTLVTGNSQLAQYLHLWRTAWNQTQLHVGDFPDGWRVNRIQTSRQSCVSISVTIITPVGRQGQLSRLHCPKNAK